MRSTAFFKLSAGIALVAVLIFSGLATSVQAGNPAQATAAGTTMASGGTDMTACAPAGMATSAAMMSSTMSAGTSATMAASTGTGAGYLGVEVAAVDNCGVKVMQIFSGSPAATTLQPGDVIVAVNCNWIGMMSDNMTMMATPDMTDCTGMMGTMMSATMTPASGTTMGPIAEFFAAVESHHPGDTIVLSVVRGAQMMNVSVTLAVLPPGVQPYSAATMAATMVATP